MSKIITALDGTWKAKGFEPKSLSEDEVPRLPIDDSWIDARVPGDIHAALLAHGLIADPMFGDNAAKCEWVSRKDWCFSRTFLARGPRGTRAYLSFDGIDTIAEVWLNGTLLGRADNMFRGYRFDVTDIVNRDGDNTVRVCIRSVRHALARIANGKYLSLFNDKRVFLRKAQCHFGWDWSPDLAATGIWKGCALIEVDEHEIDSVYVSPRIDGSVTFFVNVDLPPQRSDLDGIKVNYVPEDLALGLELSVFDREGALVATHSLPVTGGKNFATLRVENPRLWWPNGFGEPYLYRYVVQLTHAGRELDRAEGRVGIREVKLRQDPVSVEELGFLFEINGKPIFCKGANWVPADVFPGEIPRERYRILVDRAREAHFNMLRVWGGGFYESDCFYDFCDQDGIMVMQEFMCACSDLPGDQEWFQKAVIPEVEYQVTRLRNHPSIVYWIGGNETAGVTGNRPAYGEQLIHYLVRGVFGDLDPSRPYGASSPSSFSDLGSDQRSGDCHISAYEPVCVNGPQTQRDELARMRTKFNAECAYMGPLRYRSLLRFMPRDTLWPLNEMWDFRNRKNPYSWMLRDTYSRVQLKLAEDFFGAVDGVKDFLKKGMTAHAELLGTEIQYHRCRKWENSGVLFWMYNDAWPTGTHSVIDYYLMPKPSFYAVKRSYRPLIATVQGTRGAESVFIVNDLPHPVKGELVVGQSDLCGKVIWKTRTRLTMGANKSLRACDLSSRYRDIANTYVFVRFANDFQDVSCQYFPAFWKDIEWPDPALSWTLGRKEMREGGFTMEASIRAVHYARMVNISHDQDVSLSYSDNFFDMEAGTARTITLSSERDFDESGLRIGHWLNEWE